MDRKAGGDDREHNHEPDDGDGGALHRGFASRRRGRVVPASEAHHARSLVNRLDAGWSRAEPIAGFPLNEEP
jgi:hypothetical protein